MNQYTFWIPISGLGDTKQEAWENALEGLLLNTKEWAKPPEDTLKETDLVPSVLNQTLAAGFSIDHGPEEDVSLPPEETE